MHCDRESPTEAPRSRVTRRSGWTISLELPSRRRQLTHSVRQPAPAPAQQYFFSHTTPISISLIIFFSHIIPVPTSRLPNAVSAARGDDHRAKPARHQSTQKTILDLPSSLDHFVLAPILPAPALGLSSFDIKREQNKKKTHAVSEKRGNCAPRNKANTVRERKST